MNDTGILIGSVRLEAEKLTFLFKRLKHCPDVVCICGEM